MPAERIVAVIQEVTNFINSKFCSISECDLFFYGAGCANEALSKSLYELFTAYFTPNINHAVFRSDLEGAAKALYGDEPGLIGVIGTGSASGLYNGERLVDSIPSLGYVLGDEGSGAHMGKLLLNALIKRRMSSKVVALLKDYAEVSYNSILNKVYRSDAANSYLASFVPFLNEHQKEEEISTIIDYSLKLFFINNVLQYKEIPGNKIRLVGSVATIFKDRVKRIAGAYSLEADKFLSNPISDLGKYYINRYNT